MIVINSIENIKVNAPGAVLSGSMELPNMERPAYNPQLKESLFDPEFFQNKM